MYRLVEVSSRNKIWVLDTDDNIVEEYSVRDLRIVNSNLNIKLDGYLGNKNYFILIDKVNRKDLGFNFYLNKCLFPNDKYKYIITYNEDDNIVIYIAEDSVSSNEGSMMQVFSISSCKYFIKSLKVLRTLNAVSLIGRESSDSNKLLCITLINCIFSVEEIKL